MPLLHKKPFSPEQFPADLKDQEEVFFCKLTGEIFRDYDDFCERIILCNSLVWSCSLTGRSHLTYQEALASEMKVKRLLKRFPMELRIPVLYLASLCERRSLVDLAEDVYWYVKDRFFIGETVQVNISERTVCSCHILSVIPPTPEELEGYKQPTTKNGERKHWPPAELYKYEVESLKDDQTTFHVNADQLYRKKHAYNKDKNRLYIKQFVHLDSGFWRLKESSNTKYGISKVKYDQIFCGEPPVLTPKRTSPTKRGKPRQETLNKYFKHSPGRKYNISPKKSPNKNDLSRGKFNGKVQRRRRRTKKEMEEAKLRPRSKDFVEARRRAKAEKREEKLKYAEFVKEWNRKREDLECEDLKELPTPHPIETRIPHEYFGDVIMIMEFMDSFKNILPVKNFFPYGITFELVERGLVENEVAGPLSDIIQLFLSVIFDLLEQEAEERRETDVKITPNLVFERGDRSTLEVLKLATAAEAWTRQHHAAPISQLTIDTSTLTEILRLHFLSSGAKPRDKCAKWRYQARGGYCANDDPGVMLKLKEPHIIQHLSQSSVCELPIGDKVIVLNCLMNQILTMSSVRDIIDEGCDKARQCRVELRTLNAAETKREKEEAMRQKELRRKGGEKEEPETQEEVVVGSGATNNRSTRSTNGTTTDNKKEQERLYREMSQALAGAQLAPLGTDRAFRRFWVFKSLPGLFVEHKEDFPGPCLPKGTPLFNGGSGEDSLAYIRKLFEEGGNKENFSEEKLNSFPLNSPNKKLLAEKNGADSPVIMRARTKSDCIGLPPLTCWGDSSICPVHSDLSQTVSWAFYKDEVDIDLLIESLNRRGIRERQLRLALIQEKDNIIKNLPNCPIEKLSPSLVSVEKNIELRSKTGLSKIQKQYENANLNFPAGTPSDTILESSLRDLILETEEKVSSGVLGALKVKNREAWRDAIANQGYEKQCKKLTWGGKYTAKLQNLIPDENVKKEDMSDEFDKKENDSDSRASTPSLDLTLQGHIGNELEPVTQRPVVLDLASAILQIEQSIDQKYLKRPLGLDAKEREKPEMRMPTPNLERWEAALMESTSFSQLFLHLSTLDNSVMWARSAMYAYCRICRRRTDPENMLLCDTCNKGHHLYCLKPKLTKVPTGDWHCPRCKPKEKVTTVKKKRHFFSDNSDDEEEMEEDEDEEVICKVCSANGAELSCETCDLKYHLQCVVPPVRKIPKSKWFCHECRVQNSIAAQQAKTERVEPKPEKEVKQEKEAKVESDTRENSRPARNRSEPKSEKKEKGYYYEDDENESEWRAVEERRTSPQVGDTERSSRRRCSKAATAKISQFAKQLRSNAWDGDDDKSEIRESSRRRSRRSYESQEVGPDLPLDNAAWQEILEQIMRHKDAWPFIRPVTKSEVPDYHIIIKRPMDFGTIKHKLNMLEYSKNCELIVDAELIFKNCYMYNEEGSEVYKCGEKVEKIFLGMCRERNLVQSNKNGPPSSKRSRTVL